MKLKSEYYKGHKVNFVYRLLKENKQEVLAQWKIRNRLLEVAGNTKNDAYTRIKRIIDQVV